jgi:hypothetical protein
LSDFYEDLANEMANTNRYIQPDEFEDEEEKPMAKIIVHQFSEFERQEPLTEDYLVGRSQHVYQGPSHHDTMDNLRGDFRKDKYVRPLLVLRWKVLLVIGFVCFAGAVVALVAILRDLQP